MFGAIIGILIGFGAAFTCAVRILLRPHRDPAARVAWLTVLFALPGLGVIAYLLLGETNIGRKRTERMRRITAELPRPDDLPGWTDLQEVTEVSDHVAPLFRVGQSISGYPVVGGNRAALMADSNSTIDTMVADIDAAKDHVHLLFYIWLPDNNGRKMIDALKRAVARGVTVRAMVDDLGSRRLIRTDCLEEMENAGIRICRALPIGNPIMRILGGRIDLRNHRKILVIDNHITFCGSQNCADPEYLPKAKYAPWVDAVMRFEGPVARQMQHLFATDWMAETHDDMHDILKAPLPAPQPGFAAQVIATGPTVRHSAMPEAFSTLIFSAKRRLVITTPYFVPDAQLQSALCAAGNRGIDVQIIFPRRNDDFAVGGTSRSYYEELLEAGVRVYEYLPGLLHTKSMTVDDDITLIGSANMDRRSFDLNYENNILLEDVGLTADMRARQMAYLEDSEEVTLAEVRQWPTLHRLWNNALAVLGPVL